jgi:hypothetical protein
MKYAGNHGPVAGSAGFLFDQAGEDAGLLDLGDGQITRSLLPLDAVICLVRGCFAFTVFPGLLKPM